MGGGSRGADRAFDVDFAREATSAADLVGHLNLIHPNRIRVLGKPEITYYQRLDDEMRKRQMGELILLEPPFGGRRRHGATARPRTALHALFHTAVHHAGILGGRDRPPAPLPVAHLGAARDHARVFSTFSAWAC